MSKYENEIEKMFFEYEEMKIAEKDIIFDCVKKIEKHKYDRDYMYEINDSANFHGYTFQFDVDPIIKAEFDLNTFSELAFNVSRSKEKTLELIKYFCVVRDYRLILSTWYMIKVKYLISLGYLPEREYYVKNANKSIRDLFFETLQSNNIVELEVLYDFLEKIGFLYPTLEYNEFRLDMEYLLWTIEQKDKTYGYIKINTIKVALNIAPKYYFERDGKEYYNKKFSLVIKECLKRMDKKAVEKVKRKWGPNGYPVENTGYSLLFNII